MSTEAVKWAMDDAPMLLTEKGKLDTTSRHVLQALAEHAHRDGGGARPSVLRIQYRTGYDRRTVQRALRRLEDGKLITAEGVIHGCTQWRLSLQMIRPESDWTLLEAEEEALRKATAARVRRHRAKRVTHSDDVTEVDVTHSASVRNDVEVRYGADVTHSDDVRNALNAALTIKNHPTTEPSGNHHYPAPVPNLPVLWQPPAVEAVAPVQPSWLDQLQAAMSASGINVPWKFVGGERLLVENDFKRLGIPLMIRYAIDAAAGAQRGPFSSRFFYLGWRSIPTPVSQNIAPLQPKDRRQQEADGRLDRFAARAAARAAQRKEIS